MSAIPAVAGKLPDTVEAAGGPLLVIEILSPSTARYDRVEKRPVYLGHGVEYWIVDLDARVIERWMPDDARPEIGAKRSSGRREGARRGSHSMWWRTSGRCTRKAKRGRAEGHLRRKTKCRASGSGFELWVGDGLTSSLSLGRSSIAPTQSPEPQPEARHVVVAVRRVGLLRHPRQLRHRPRLHHTRARHLPRGIERERHLDRIAFTTKRVPSSGANSAGAPLPCVHSSTLPRSDTTTNGPPGI